jgi:hypothetical protein
MCAGSGSSCVRPLKQYLAPGRYGTVNSPIEFLYLAAPSSPVFGSALTLKSKLPQRSDAMTVNSWHIAKIAMGKTEPMCFK